MAGAARRYPAGTRGGARCRLGAPRDCARSTRHGDAPQPVRAGRQGRRDRAAPRRADVAADGRRGGSVNRLARALTGTSQPRVVTYATAGDPDLVGSRDVVRAMARGGADVIEIGVPFSDPIADGPA